MRKIFLGIIFIIMMVVGCAGGAKPTTNSAESSTENSGILTLDQALKDAAIRIDERIVGGSKIAPLNFNSPHDKFSNYVLDELTANLVDTQKLTIVDRKEVDLIRGEFDFQFSGEVGDDSMQELGRMLGAQSIISGSLTDLGEFYRIMIRVLNVQSARVEIQYRANIANDNIVKALLTGGRTSVTTANVPRQTPSGSQTQTTQAPTAVVQTQTPVEPVQKTFPFVGTWKVTGRDSANWGGELVIEEVNRERISGYFDWYRNNVTYSGREYFRGTYDVKDRLVVVEGYRLVNPSGIALGKYQAFLSRTGFDFISGTWAGGGTWQAQFQE